jgi:hypothetical protein
MLAYFSGLEDPRIATEREFQNVAKLRLNMLFAGSAEGAHRACILLGIVATCRAVGVPVQAYRDRSATPGCAEPRSGGGQVVAGACPTVSARARRA